MSVPILNNKQPIYNQLSLQFTGPLYKDMIVDNVNNLTIVSPVYDGIVVFVRSEHSHYYKLDGVNGSQLDHWKKVGSELLIELWDYDKEYQINTCVIYDNSLYWCLQQSTGNNPSSSPLYWQKISADIYQLRLQFTNQSEIVTNIPFQNPITSIYINNELIDSYVKLESDGNGGSNITVKFYENSLLTTKTGYIIFR